MTSRLFRAALLIILVLPVLANAQPRDEPDHFGIEVKILRRPGQEDFASQPTAYFVAVVVVRRLDTNQICFEPKWPLTLGSKVTGRIEDPALRLALTTSFLAEMSSVTYDVKVIKEGEALVASQGIVQFPGQ